MSNAPDESTLAVQLQKQKENTFAQESWLNFWQTTDTPPWHFDSVSKGLKLHYDLLMQGKKDAVVFVPLCGRSVELLWLREQGHTVIGVELSELAIEGFFSANSLPFDKEIRNDVTIYKSKDGRILIFMCDILEFKRELIPDVEISAVWDRGSFVAMDPISRPRYVDVISSLMSSGAKSLFERVDYEGDYAGPPFCFTNDELSNLCGKHFDVEYLSERRDERFDEWLLKYFLFTKK